MRSGNSKLCRYCRNAGGKAKDISTYDVFKGFTPVSIADSRVTYICNTCNSDIERTLAHINTSEYIVCEVCYPKVNFGARQYTELGYFDSKFEYEAYKTLLKYLDSSLIVRQKKYHDLFNTNSKHTADFYIPTLDLVLEVTTKSNNIGTKYTDTAAWKLSLSSMVRFAYSLSEVEDIVRLCMKVQGVSVDHSRNVLRRRIEWR